MTSRTTTSSSTAATIKSFNSGRWTLEENLMFERGLRLFGRGHWKQISAFMKTRSRDQCKSHFQKLEALFLKKQQQQQQRQREALAVAAAVVNSGGSGGGGSSSQISKWNASASRRHPAPMENDAAVRNESCWWSSWIPTTNQCPPKETTTTNRTVNSWNVRATSETTKPTTKLSTGLSPSSSRRNGHTRKAVAPVHTSMTTRNQSKKHKIHSVMEATKGSGSIHVAPKANPSFPKTTMSHAASSSPKREEFHSRPRPETPPSAAGHEHHCEFSRKRKAENHRSSCVPSEGAWMEQKPPQRRRLLWHVQETNVLLHGRARRRPSLLPPTWGRASMKGRRSGSTSLLHHSPYRTRSMGVPPPPPPLWPPRAPGCKETSTDNDAKNNFDHRNPNSTSLSDGAPTTPYKSRSVAVVTPSNLPSSSSLSSISSSSRSSSPSSPDEEVVQAPSSDSNAVRGGIIDTDKTPTKNSPLAESVPPKDKENEHDLSVPYRTSSPQEDEEGTLCSIKRTLLFPPGFHGKRSEPIPKTTTSTSKTAAAPPLKKRKIIRQAQTTTTTTNLAKTEEKEDQKQHESVPYLPNLNDTSNKSISQDRTLSAGWKSAPSKDDQTVASILCSLSKMAGAHRVV